MDFVHWAWSESLDPWNTGILASLEDWPVMPVMWHTFEPRPFGLFDRNPALDLPRK